MFGAALLFFGTTQIVFGATQLAFGATQIALPEEALSPEEQTQLVSGECITRQQEAIVEGRSLVSSVSYTLLPQGSSDVFTVLDDPEAIARMLPLVQGIRRVPSRTGGLLLEIHQGNSMVHAEYTLRFERSKDIARFWLDPSRPHDIDDVWGFFRVQHLETGEVLFTAGTMIDLGDGMLRGIVEPRIRRALATVPKRLRRMVAPPAQLTSAEHR